MDPDKAKAIREMLVSKMKKEIRGFIGKLQFISRFIAKLTSVCKPIFKLLKKISRSYGTNSASLHLTR